jgi:hypothetical protein
MIDCDVQGIKVERGQTAGWRRGGGAAAARRRGPKISKSQSVECAEKNTSYRMNESINQSINQSNHRIIVRSMTNTT